MRPLLLFATFLALANSTAPSSLATRRSSLATSEWRRTGSDEFNPPDGSLPDPKKWTYDLGGNGWGNHELQSYTARPENAKIMGGNLVITARQEQYTGVDGI